MADTKLSALTNVSTPAGTDLIYGEAGGTSFSYPLHRMLAFMAPHLFQARLTTETGMAVSTSDRTAQGTIYLTPYNGNRLALFDGTRWKLYALTEISLALSSLTTVKNYDVFVYDNAGTLTLELSAAWTNDTTRADALTTQDGVTVKTGATTRRWVGTIRTTGTTTTEDSKAKRFVWNNYNRVRRRLFVEEATASWTYNSTTVRQANASTANQVEAVVGVAEVTVDLSLCLIVLQNQTTTNPSVGNASIQEDATNSFGAENLGCTMDQLNATTADGLYGGIWQRYLKQPATGYHFYAWVERCQSAAQVTFFGSDGTNGRRSGISGWIEG